MSTVTEHTTRKTAEDGRPPADPESTVAKVRERYGAIAEGRISGCGDSSPTRSSDGCCGETAAAAMSHRLGYGEAELATIPAEADLGLGCGAPIPLLDLQPGEVVLDLGSGPGLDALLAARRVGSEGKVIGVDMTDAMIRRARAAAEGAGFEQVEFRQGRLEALPVADASVDAVTSNCVINLVPDKAQVFREVARVLKPGGRLVIADVVLTGRLPEAIEQDVLAYVGCVAGAMEMERYFATIEAAGLGDIEVLRNADALELFADSVPPEAAELLERTGVEAADLAGKVRSITFRAVKR
jgi:arsenite methyltransferase